MKKFKIFQIYIVTADDADAAKEKLSQAVNPMVFLDAQFVKEDEENSWKAAVKRQF